MQAVLCLAEEGGEGPTTVDELAKRLKVPRNYLSKILHVLARTEILESTRGPGGGFRLALPADELTLAQVARHFDDLPSETTCLLGRDRCSDSDPCPVHERWTGVRGAIMDLLEQTRLADLAPDQAPAEDGLRTEATTH